MGRVAVAAVIESVEDLYRVRRGELSEADVRRVAVDDALVDTGATNLSMPSSMIAKFGLLRLRNRRAMTTNGIREVAIYGAVQLKIQGRDCLCDVTEVADGCPVLIGQVPLELMDLVVDHGNSGLMGNPAHADDGGSRSDRIIDLKPIGSSELQLTFGDSFVGRDRFAKLGLDSKRFKVRTARLTGQGDGIEVQRRHGDEWAVFDAASLRCRVDPAYAKKVHDSMDTHYVPKDVLPQGNPPPRAWYAEDHGSF